MTVAEASIKAGAVFDAETSLIDLAISAEMGNVTARSFLEFIDGIAAELSRRVPQGLRAAMKKQVLDLFVNFGETDSRYREKVGEMAATVTLLRSPGAKLVGVEVEMPSIKHGKTIDIAVELGSGSRIAIEIMNVQIKDERVQSKEGLDLFLSVRRQRKIDCKMGQQNSAGAPFLVLPVVWCQIETLRKFAPGLTVLPCGNELSICTVVQLNNEQGVVGFAFGSVPDICK